MTDRKVDIINEGFDMAFWVGTLQDSSCVVRHLGSARLAISAAPDYLERFGRPTRLEDLEAHQCLQYGYWTNPSTWKLAQGRTISIKGSLTANNGDILRRAALSGLGIAMLPRFLVGPDLLDGGLEEILHEWAPAMGGAYIIYPPDRHLSVKVQALVDFAIEGLGAAAWEFLPEDAG